MRSPWVPREPARASHGRHAGRSLGRDIGRRHGAPVGFPTGRAGTTRADSAAAPAIARAWWQFFAELEPLIPDDVYDAGDAEFRIYPLGRVACHGLRGHSRIYQATHRPKEDR